MHGGEIDAGASALAACFAAARSPAARSGCRAARTVEVARRGRARDACGRSCDLLAMSGGWNPTVGHLTSHLGGRPGRGDDISPSCPMARLPACSRRRRQPGISTLAPAWSQGLPPAGAARPRDAASAGRACRRRRGFFGADAALAGRAARARPSSISSTTSRLRMSSWRSAKGFVSVEHLKRYTTLGMATDQGKTSNVNPALPSWPKQLASRSPRPARRASGHPMCRSRSARFAANASRETEADAADADA
jgi:hypothetical protein